MKTSPGFIDRIRQEEGFSSTSYWDDAPGGGDGQWTWGYGTVAPGENCTVSREDAEKALQAEIEEAEKDYRAVFQTDPPGLSQVKYEALVDMLFNLGLTRFGGFHNTIAAIRAGDWGMAAKHAEQSLWYRQVGARAQRVCREFRYAVPVVAPTEPEKAEPPLPTVSWWAGLLDMLGKLFKGGK